MGRTITKDNFHHSQKLEPCKKEIGTSSRTSEGSMPPGSPVGPTEGPPHHHHVHNMKVVTTYLTMGPWGEIFAPSTLQESYSIQDHLLPMD